MSRHLWRFPALATSALVALILSLGAALPASAVKVSDHGVGYLWSGDGVSWIGSYRLADGTLAFCLQAGKATPIGADFSYTDGAALGWFSTDDSARLAYISRRWAASSDPTTAAAGQLATWTIAGLNGRTQAWYASRGGTHAGEIVSLANQMLNEASEKATRAVSAKVVLSLPEAGTSSVRIDLAADQLSGGLTSLAPGSHSASATLTGATFQDGSPTKTIPNGTEVPITPTGTEPTVSVAVSATFTSLPYGNDIIVAFNEGPVQNLLVARPATAEANAQAALTAPSPLPFQPAVATQTSAAEAEPGTHISDLLTVSVVETTDGSLLPSWGVFEADGQLIPISATVRSSLLGPFSESIVPAASAPSDAPVVCTVEVTVTAPGDYRTPDCTLPGAGWYVWVESIAPESTPSDQGSARLRPWTSSFGVASEVTRATLPATPPSVARLAKTGSNESFLPIGISGAATLFGAALLTSAGVRARRRRQAPIQ